MTHDNDEDEDAIEVNDMRPEDWAALGIEIKDGADLFEMFGITV